MAAASIKQAREIVDLTQRDLRALPGRTGRQGQCREQRAPGEFFSGEEGIEGNRRARAGPGKLPLSWRGHKSTTNAEA